MKKILEIRNIYISYQKMNFLNPCIFAVYPIGVGYMVTHRGREGKGYVRFIKNLQIIHINKS